MQVSKLSVDSHGRVTGTCPNGQPVQHNAPWPCRNGSNRGMSVPSGIMGLLVHTQVGNNPGSIGWFNDSRSQASAHFCIAQDGAVVQMGPVNGWKAWHCAEGNPHWYGCEFADDGRPAIALTAAQVAAAAQLLELLSRPGVGNFPMQITNSTGTEGLGWHGMGGSQFGGHFDCPGEVRKAQRPAILKLAEQIRAGGHTPPAPPAARHWRAEGMLPLAALCAADLHEPVSEVLTKTLQNSGHAFAANLAAHVNAVFAADTTHCPDESVWYYPVAKGAAEWTSRGMLALSDLASHLGTDPATMIALTIQHAGLKPLNSGYVNAVFAASPIHLSAGCVVYY